MVKIAYETIVETVKNMVIGANTTLEKPLTDRLRQGMMNETSSLAKNVLKAILENEQIAKKEAIPLCQDTGIAVVFLEIGRDLLFDYDLEGAIQQGVREGYLAGYLRKSVVKHPLQRVNTSDNTPAIVHFQFNPGDELTIHFAPKGAGSENMSRLAMLTPAEGEEGIIRFVLETIVLAGGKPCPPIIVGIGIGGNFEKSALLAKAALFRPLDDEALDPIDNRLEKEVYQKINALGIGPMALGGETTCLSVKVNSYPCHIASLPVAVNIQCHSARKAHATLRGKSE